MRKLMKDLTKALSVKRKHGSVSEATYVAALAARIKPTLIDGAGNLHLDKRAGNTTTLFVAHTDTISKGEGYNPVVKNGEWWNSAPNSTLGSDDGAGIALLLHLIDSGVPGYYIFCRGEECGGLGSSYLANEHSELLKQFDRAIAFDRKGFSDVITDQMYGKCCSDEFATALSTALCTEEMIYCPDSSGVFTDTANFMDYITECTNVSCGYENEHSYKERLNITHLQRLAAQIVLIDWEALPTVARPRELPPKTSYSADWDSPSKHWDSPSKSWNRPFDTAPDDTSDDDLDTLYEALDAAAYKEFEPLNKLLQRRYHSSITVSKLRDTEYFLSELDSGATATAVLEDIYWSAN